MITARLNGVPVRVSPLLTGKQRVKISDHFPWITDQARAEIDRDLLAMFGHEPEQSYSALGTLFVGQHTFNQLRVSHNFKVSMP